MRTYQDTAGSTWTTLPVRARSREHAIQLARSDARREGYRVVDVGQAMRQGESRVWHVYLSILGECE